MEDGCVFVPPALPREVSLPRPRGDPLVPGSDRRARRSRARGTRGRARCRGSRALGSCVVSQTCLLVNTSFVRCVCGRLKDKYPDDTPS